MFYAIGLDGEKSSPTTTRPLDISYSMNTPGSSFSGATTASTCSSSKHSSAMSATLSSDINPAVNAQSVQTSSMQENSQGEDQITSQVEKGNITGKTNTRGRGKKNQ